jgi:hypothetical protein
VFLENICIIWCFEKANNNGNAVFEKYAKNLIAFIASEHPLFSLISLVSGKTDA